MNDSIIPPNDMFQVPFSVGIEKPRAGMSKVSLPLYVWEMMYQCAVTVVLLVFFSFYMDQTEDFSFQHLFAPYKLAFFTNYLVASLVISYVFLPLLYYKKHILLFAFASIVMIAVVVLVDEFVLEKIYFPDTRGAYFPGFTYTIVETMPIIIILVAFKMAWDFNKKQREVDNLKSLVKESEIQYLKSQINPHFLFNNLNNLYAYAIDYSPKTPAIILDLSTVLRYMLYDCREDLVALRKEVDHLKKYTSLFQLQLDKRGQVVFDEEIQDENYHIPPLILAVFVENAFKHSTGSQAGKIKVNISIIVKEGGRLSFHCSNNYARCHQSIGTASGIGLQNVVKRLELLFPKKHKLNITKEENEFSVTLEMPLQKM